MSKRSFLTPVKRKEIDVNKESKEMVRCRVIVHQRPKCMSKKTRLVANLEHGCEYNDAALLATSEIAAEPGADAARRRRCALSRSSVGRGRGHCGSATEDRLLVGVQSQQSAQHRHQLHALLAGAQSQVLHAQHTRKYYTYCTRI